MVVVLHHWQRWQGRGGMLLGGLLPPDAVASAYVSGWQLGQWQAMAMHFSLLPILYPAECSTETEEEAERWCHPPDGMAVSRKGREMETG